MSCLSKDPAKRPDIEDFLRMLQEDWAQDLVRGFRREVVSGGDDSLHGRKFFVCLSLFGRYSSMT